MNDRVSPSDRAHNGHAVCRLRRAEVSQDVLVQSPSPFVRDLIMLVVHQLWFLDSCDDEVVDLDDAVKQMEWISHVLDRRSEADRRTILAVVAELADEEQDPDLREFLESFGQTTGLIPSED